MAALLLLLPLLLPASPASAHAGALPVAATTRADDLEEAKARFLRASQGRERAEAAAALEKLVQLGDLGAVDAIVAEYTRVSEQVRGARHGAEDASMELERRRVLYERMQQKAESDPKIAARLEDEQERIEKLEEKLERDREKVTDGEPWCAAMGDAVDTLFAAARPEKRKKAEGVLRKDAEEHPELSVRRASIDLLGRVGATGTASELLKLALDWSADASKIQGQLPKLMVDVRKLERRMQEDGEQNGGRVNRGLQQQYDQVKKEASQARRQIHDLTQLADAASVAAGRALAREQGRDLQKSLASLVRGLKKAKGRGRLNALSALAHADSEDVRAHMRQALAVESEPLARARLIDGLALQRDPELPALLFDVYLSDENWYVRSRAVAALDHLRVRDAIPVLIGRLGQEEGRLRTDVSEALQSLTGKNFRTNVELWSRWWKDVEEGFVVPEAAAVSATEEAVDTSGVTFFGITTESQRVLFVLDLSGSMEFSMTPRNNPDDDPGRPYDFPGANDVSRLVTAKRDLIKALGGLRDGGLFNLVLYASDVWTWADELTDMDPDSREEVLEYIDALKGVGATNIYGALDQALTLAGATGGGEWSEPEVDTIYVLTDGRASIGLTQDTEEILAHVRELNDSAGIVIHTIGLSAAHDTVLLRRLAEENGGTYVAR